MFNNKKKIPLEFCLIENAEGMTAGKIYFIHENAGGTDFYFMVDTGASCSIFDIDFVTGALKKVPAPHAGKITLTVTGDQLRPSIFEDEIFGVKGKYFCADLIFLSKKFHSSIAGIIGTDLLSAIGAVLNLKKNIITHGKAKLPGA